MQARTETRLPLKHLEQLDLNKASSMRPLEKKPVNAASERAQERAPDREKKAKQKLSALCKTPPSTITGEGKGLFQRGLCLGEVCTCACLLVGLTNVMKGGFARCFQVKDASGQLFAAKTVAKISVRTTKTRAKLLSEINIHKVLKHPNVVQFIDCFEDDINVYILLEMCSNNSMMNMIRKRKSFTEPEAKYFLTQIMGGVMYMHDIGVIHRDLKLGNIFLHQNMSIKIGDFGLAALLTSENDRKKTICGTPNYIAPEVLFGTEQGHSYEVDVWSVGIILYTMIVGKPPFQSKDVDTIYNRIKHNDYSFPPDSASPEAKELIAALLHHEPTKRPKLDHALSYEFFKSQFPASITAISLTRKPKFPPVTSQESEANFVNCKVASRIMLRPAGVPKAKVKPALARGLSSESAPAKSILPVSLSPASTKDKYKMIMVQKEEVNHKLNFVTSQAAASASAGVKSMENRAPLGRARRVNAVEDTENIAKTAIQNNARRLKLVASSAMNNNHQAPHAANTEENFFVNCNINPGKTACFEAACKVISSCISEFENPSVDMGTPHVDTKYSPTVQYISKWVDYSNKYGISYQFPDGMVGVLFSDRSTMQMDPRVESYDNIRWSTSSKQWVVHRTSDISKCLPSQTNKFRVVQNMYSYMEKNLREGSDQSELPCVTSARRDPRDLKNTIIFLVQYRRLGQVVMFQLSNGSFQFNFPDHTKIILTSGGKTIGFIDSDRNLHCWNLPTGRMCCEPFCSQITEEFMDDIYGKLWHCLQYFMEEAAATAADVVAAAGGEGCQGSV